MSPGDDGTGGAKGEVGVSSAFIANDGQTKWQSIDAEGMFLEGSDEERYDKKENYIFGTQVKGTGYYHFHTKEAYNIILENVNKKINKVREETKCCCIMVIFLPCSMFCGTYALLSSLRKKRKEFEDMYTLIEARMNAPGPISSDLDISDKLIARLNKRNESRGEDANGGGGATHYDIQHYSDPNYIVNHYDHYMDTITHSGGGGGDHGGGGDWGGDHGGGGDGDWGGGGGDGDWGGGGGGGDWGGGDGGGGGGCGGGGGEY